jgi:tetratricopeptide (TPR) repeat protein
VACGAALPEAPRLPSGPRQRVEQLGEEAVKRAQERKFAEALELCARALELDPNQGGVHALRGQIHYHSGHMPEAAVDCSAAIDRGVRHPEIYFMRAIAFDSSGRVEDALADFSVALDLNPEHAPARNSRGWIRCRLGRFEEGLEDFSQAIRIAPKWYVPYFGRAQILHGRGQLDSALHDYDRAAELIGEAAPKGTNAEVDPMMALVHCRRGDARYDLFREEEAEADFDEGCQLNSAAAAGYLGEMWLRRSKFGRAMEVFAQLIELLPKDARGYLGRGMAQEALGDLEQAAADYSAAISLQPDGGAGYVLRARVRHGQGRVSDALADLSQHVRTQPKDPMAYLFRASLHQERKALAAAVEDLNAAHGIVPEHPQVCNNLAWMLATFADAKLRDGSRAVALARQACQATDWKYPFYLGTFAAALAETGAFPEAIHWQTQALDLYPEEEMAAGRARLELYEMGQACREPL